MEPIYLDKISSQEMAILDNNSEWLGIPKSYLMECAGYSVATEIVSRYNLGNDSKVLIFCGTGNNGGDGFVVARHLNSFGIDVLLGLIGDPEKIRTKEAQLNWNIISNYLNHSIEIIIVRDSTELGNFGIILDKEANFKLIIDALLGTGVQGIIRDPISTAIDFINEIKHQKHIPIVSIDVPSGLDPNTGKVPDKSVFSDLTITFHRLKEGMKIDNKYISQIVIKSIGIPKEANLFIGRGDLLPTIKVRRKDNHKGQFGRILVIGGSKNYSGAPAYSSLTGINFGIDLVITYVPNVIGDVLRSFSPNMIVRTYPGDWLNDNAYDEISGLIDWSNAVLIGPGIGQEKETENLLVKLLKRIKQQNKKLVLDADALKLVKDHLNLIKGVSVILTPHEGELKIMTGIDLPPFNNIQQRGNMIFELAKKLNVTLVIKGPYDYISDGKNLKVNRTGCAEMSIGGTGDVLAGLCTCFLATENDTFHSACSAAFLNGYLGEYCKKLQPRFTPMDMINNLSNAITELLNFSI